MPGTNDTPTDEIMIWLYTANGAAPTGTKTTVTIDSASSNISRGSTTWNVFSYVRTANATSAVINVMDCLNDLVTRGWVPVVEVPHQRSVRERRSSPTAAKLDTTGYYCRIR